MTCAKCGKDRELCQSATQNGVKQPMVCKDCLIESMRSDNWKVNDAFWVKQLAEAGEKDSIISLGLSEVEANMMIQVYKKKDTT